MTVNLPFTVGCESRNLAVVSTSVNGRIRLVYETILHVGPL